MKRLLVLLAVFLSSCSGFRVKSYSNPFEHLGIKSVAVPIFINRSPLSEVSYMMTREVKSLLAKYNGLSVSSTFSSNSDAVLIGIVGTTNKLRDVQTKPVGGMINTKDSTIESSLGDRNNFNVSQVESLILEVRLVLIRRPRSYEVELVKSDLADKLLTSPRIVFNEILPLSNTFARRIKGRVDAGLNLSPDTGGVVNGTYSNYERKQALESMAVSLADSFEELVVNVF